MEDEIKDPLSKYCLITLLPDNLRWQLTQSFHSQKKDSEWRSMRLDTTVWNGYLKNNSNLNLLQNSFDDKIKVKQKKAIICHHKLKDTNWHLTHYFSKYSRLKGENFLLACIVQIKQSKNNSRVLLRSSKRQTQGIFHHSKLKWNKNIKSKRRLNHSSSCIHIFLAIHPSQISHKSF